MKEASSITDEYRYYLLRKRHGENLIVAAFRGLRQKGIEPVLIKGWAAARNYPEGVPRFFGDVDLAVSLADYERARHLIDEENLGGIDLHRELRILDTVSWQRLMENSELTDLDGEPIRVLRAEDHLRVLCVHWLNNGGENRTRLLDIVYAVRNSPPEFDWSRCLDPVSPTRQGWIIASIGIAHRYMDLEIEGLPFAEEAKRLPDWLTRCVEKEWASNLDTLALETQLRNPLSLINQIKKRIPPNPILATIRCEGRLTSTRGERFGYQLRHMAERLKDWLQSESPSLRER